VDLTLHMQLLGEPLVSPIVYKACNKNIAFSFLFFLLRLEANEYINFCPEKM
jgi:hypothetical protein